MTSLILYAKSVLGAYVRCLNYVANVALTDETGKQL
jgi:hypothetical protein